MILLQKRGGGAHPAAKSQFTDLKEDMRTRAASKPSFAPQKRTLFALSVLAFLPLLGPSASQPQQDRVALPSLQGSYAVGRREYVWTDPRRLEIAATQADQHRKLVVWIYYPAAPSTQPPSPVLPAPWTEAIVAGAKGNKWWNESREGALAGRRAHAVDNAAVASAPKSFPVVLFMPGFGQMPTAYTYLIENLASDGFIVVAINPTGFVPVTLFPSGDVVGNRIPAGIPTAALDLVFPWWVEDARFVSTELVELNKSAKDPLRGRMDLAHLGMAGHSFGGATAAQMVHDDPEFSAGIDMDGRLFGSVYETGAKKPFMIFDSHSDFKDYSTDEDWKQFEKELEECDRRWRVFSEKSSVVYTVTIKKTDHGSYLDEALLPSDTTIPALAKKAEIIMPGARSLPLIGQYVNAFFETYLAGRCSPLLNESARLVPEMTIDRTSGAPRGCAK
jgi:dienelactone hydrolase